MAKLHSSMIHLCLTALAACSLWLFAIHTLQQREETAHDYSTVESDHHDRSDPILFQKILPRLQGQNATAHDQVDIVGKRYEHATEQGFHNAEVRGCLNNAYCYLMDEHLPADRRTPFTHPEELREWGWDDSDPSEPAGRRAEWYPLKAGFEHFDLESDKWKVVEWAHRHPTTHEGIEYPATGPAAGPPQPDEAHFRALYSTEFRFIASTDSRGPAHVKDPPPKDQLVELRSWSDVTYLTWASLHAKGEPLKPPRYIARLAVTTWETKAIIADLLNLRMPVWPGREFDPESKEGQALMGTAHGNGVAYFLMQHKEQLGALEVEKISIWESFPDVDKRPELRGKWASMLFTIRYADGRPVEAPREHGSPEAKMEPNTESEAKGKGSTDSSGGGGKAVSEQH